MAIPEGMIAPFMNLCPKGTEESRWMGIGEAYFGDDSGDIASFNLRPKEAVALSLVQMISIGISMMENAKLMHRLREEGFNI